MSRLLLGGETISISDHTLSAHIKNGLAVCKVGSARVAFYLLFIAMLFLGATPQGTMRVADADGSMRIVICTGNGPLDLWQNADGSVSEHAPDGSQTERSYACINVLIAKIGVQHGDDLEWGVVAFARYRLPFASRQVVGQRHQTPQQPRAPPYIS